MTEENRQVAELREGAKEAKRVLAAVVRERDSLSGELIAVREGAGSSVAAASSRAERLLEAAVGTLRARPPCSVEPAYVEGFVGRNRGIAFLGVSPYLSDGRTGARRGWCSTAPRASDPR